MKNMNIIPDSLAECTTIVRYLIHEGKEIYDRNGREARNMQCPSCKGNDGYLAPHRRETAWFCANIDCINKSSNPSRIEGRVKWNTEMFGNPDASFR